MKHELFISYSRVDSAFVLRLVGDLRERGVEAWLDQLDIPPGANWDSEIERALDQAKTVLVVLSAVSAKSENLKNEIGAALERRKQVVPVVLAKGAVPLMINRLQREDFTGEYGPAFGKLLHRLSGGSRTGSLRAISPADVQRAASEAAARLGLKDGAEVVAVKPGFNTLLREQFEKLDKNGDGVLTRDEMQGLHADSVPDSLAPRTRHGARSAGSASSRRGLLAGGAGVLLVAGVALAFALKGRKPPVAAHVAAPPELPSASQVLLAGRPAPFDASASVTSPMNVAPATEPATHPANAPAEPAPAVALVATGVEAPQPGTIEVTQQPPAEEPTTPASAEVELQAQEPDEQLRPQADRRRGAAVVCGRPDFRGLCQKIPRQPDMHKSPLGNDVASSVRLGTCRSVRICSEIQFNGQCEVLSADQPDLSKTSVGIKNLSSIECVGLIER